MESEPGSLADVVEKEGLAGDFEGHSHSDIPKPKHPVEGGGQALERGGRPKTNGTGDKAPSTIHGGSETVSSLFAPNIQPQPKIRSQEPANGPSSPAPKSPFRPLTIQSRSRTQLTGPS